MSIPMDNEQLVHWQLGLAMARLLAAKEHLSEIWSCEVLATGLFAEDLKRAEELVESLIERGFAGERDARKPNRDERGKR